MAEEKKQAEAEGEEGAATEAPKPKSSRKTLFIVLAVVGVILLAGVPVVIIQAGKKPTVADGMSLDIPQSQLHPAGAAQEESPEDLELEEGEAPVGAFVPMDPFIVNLRGGRFLRLQVQIEFNEKDIPSRWTTRGPILRDAVVTLLTKKKAEDLLEEDGVDILKRNIREVLNEGLKKEYVKDVLITQIVVQ